MFNRFIISTAKCCLVLVCVNNHLQPVETSIQGDLGCLLRLQTTEVGYGTTWDQPRNFSHIGDPHLAASKLMIYLHVRGVSVPSCCLFPPVGRVLGGSLQPAAVGWKANFNFPASFKGEDDNPVALFRLEAGA